MWRYHADGTLFDGHSLAPSERDTPLEPEPAAAGAAPPAFTNADLGEHIGSGGNKDVYAINDDQVIAVLKPGKNPTLLDDEFTLLDQLRDLGLPVVDAQPVEIDGQPAMLMDRYAQGSKDIVRTVRIGGERRVVQVGGADLLNQRSIDDLQRIRTQLVNDRIRIDDLQFLIGFDGSIVLADPLDVREGIKPSRVNLRTINLLIAAARGNQ
jgi:hypothetical protein